MLEKERGKLARLADKLLDLDGKEPDLSRVDLYLKTVDRLTKVVDTKLHYSGADQPDASEPKSLTADAIRERVRSIFGPRAAPADAGDDADEGADPRGPAGG